MANGRHTPKEILLGKKPNLNNLIFLDARYLSMLFFFIHVAFLWVTMNNQKDFGATTHQIIVTLNPIFLKTTSPNETSFNFKS